MPSKRMRWEVFRRDNFTCYYCSAKPPDVQLELDHVVPQALGGPDDNDPAHYVAACRDCNRGKSSSSPDAPLVAAVAEDAVRWAQAMRAAQAQMLKDAQGCAAERAQFDEWWQAWGYGSGETRREVLRDPGWELTIDHLVSAGLPLSILKDCISLAMSQKKVLPENKFRYMCGVAWTKVRQLQINAKRILDGDAPMPAYMDGDAGYDQGRIDLARELFEQIGEDEQQHMLDYVDAGGEPTQGAVMSAAADWAFSYARGCLSYLLERIDVTIGTFPAEIGFPALRSAPELTFGVDSLESLARRAVEILECAADILNLPEAAAYLASMSAPERDEWRGLAIVLHCDRELSEDEVTLRAAECAREVSKLPGGWRLRRPAGVRRMCKGPGEHIPACSRRASFRAWFNESGCCKRGTERCAGHLICEQHLTCAMDGGVDSKGSVLTAQDYEALDPDLLEAPF
jgi:HNH endonuclease